MTKRHRSFVTKTATPDTESDLSFDLGDEHYTCHQDIQGAVLLEFIAAADESSSAAGAKILSFFEEALPADQHARFVTQIKSKDEIIEMETLSDIIAYLIESYTTRPTKASGSSDAGS